MVVVVVAMLFYVFSDLDQRYVKFIFTHESVCFHTSSLRAKEKEEKS